MDSETTMLALIVVLTCMMPILILKLRSALKKRKFTKLLYRLAQNHNSTVSEYDHWNNSAIGLNGNGTQLFTLRFENDEATPRVIHLSSIVECNLINDNTGADFKEGNFKVTNAVDLELARKDDHPERISFYNIERDGHLLTGELDLANKWRGKINECIAQRTPLYAGQRNKVPG